MSPLLFKKEIHSEWAQTKQKTRLKDIKLLQLVYYCKRSQVNATNLENVQINIFFPLRILFQA